MKWEHLDYLNPKNLTCMEVDDIQEITISEGGLCPLETITVDGVTFWVPTKKSLIDGYGYFLFQAQKENKEKVPGLDITFEELAEKKVICCEPRLQYIMHRAFNAGGDNWFDMTPEYRSKLEEIIQERPTVQEAKDWLRENNYYHIPCPM